MTSKANHTPILAQQADAAALAFLLCSAKNEIKLKDHVCTDEGRPELERWFVGRCSNSWVWVLRERGQLAALMVLDRTSRDKIEYVAVRKDLLRGGRAEALVRHAMSLAPWWCAVPQNDKAQGLLAKLGFAPNVNEAHVHEAWHWPPD